MQLGDFIEQHGWKALSLVGTVIASIYTYGVSEGRKEINALKEDVKTDISRVETKVDTVINMLGGTK